MGRSILVVGGGIGGLTAAIAFRNVDFKVDIVELNPAWSVYGVGIIQQANVVRAMAQLGILDEYLAASFGFDKVQIQDIDGRVLANIPSPRLAGDQYPANLGVGRPALHDVLKSKTKASGADVRLGLSVERLEPRGDVVDVTFTDGTTGTYDLVVGADGVNSKVRALAFGENMKPRFTGQAVWRHNFARPPEVDCLCAVVSGEHNAGLVPLSETLMYVYVTSEEAGNPKFPREQLPDLMRERMKPFGGLIGQLRDLVGGPDDIVYRPMEALLVPAPWNRGRIVLIGDAAHATTPHLGQGAGMAVEDSIVLAEEMSRDQSFEDAMEAFMERRFERCKFVVETSVQIGDWEMEGRHDIDRAALVRRMNEVTSAPI